MPSSPVQNEPARLEALRLYRVLDTGSEQAFDDIVALAAFICGVPIALISLMDEDRQWFKAKVGLEASETPRDQAFCAHTILGRDSLVVEDAQQDPRFAANPLVTGAPHVRFYAGTPLITPEGHALGTLCIIDRFPRKLSKDQHNALEALGRQVSLLLEFRRTSHELATALEKVKTLAPLVPICAYCRRIREDDGFWDHLETFIRKNTDSQFSHGICPDCAEIQLAELDILSKD